MIDVPARTAHRTWNAGKSRVSATWTVTPVLRTEEMFRFIDRASAVAQARPAGEVPDRLATCLSITQPT
ncbi:hypothetical protein [Kibdelosporangium aridum]|uniref:hypothetical protein n=1 Tax=Kibdelosporangium aridum TaxID=2030 RepID=UPI000525AFC3